MFTPNTNTTKQETNQTKLDEAFRILRKTGAALTDGLRQRHEGALRRLPRVARMRSVNATPV